MFLLFAVRHEKQKHHFQNKPESETIVLIDIGKTE
jgi:hypothetical protein